MNQDILMYNTKYLINGNGSVLLYSGKILWIHAIMLIHAHINMLISQFTNQP